MKNVLNWTLAIILIILLPIYIVWGTWVLGGEILSWAFENWIIAALIVVVFYQSRQIRKLEQEIQWLWDEQSQTPKHRDQ
jgi:predicted ABC-type exoprotein transport system permease subunit